MASGWLEPGAPMISSGSISFTMNFLTPSHGAKALETQLHILLGSSLDGKSIYIFLPAFPAGVSLILSGS